MTSFGWKRKQVTLQENPSTSGFSEEDDRDPEVESGEIDWLTAAKRHRGGALEDGRTKAERLRSDGVVLAESGRFWEAIRIWDEALGLTPDDARLYEMKAQVCGFGDGPGTAEDTVPRDRLKIHPFQALIELREDFAAVQSAEEAVRYDPLWAEARQTLGRAQLNLGEPHMVRYAYYSIILTSWNLHFRP